MRESCIMCLTANRARTVCADRDFRLRNVAEMLINRRGAFTLYKIPLLYSPLVEIGNDSTEILHKPRINGEYDCIFSAFRMPDFPGFSAENIHSNIQDFQPHGICRTPSAGLSGSAFFMFGRGSGGDGDEGRNYTPISWCCL